MTRAELAEELARKFHEAYERMAPQFGYETRAKTRQFDPESPNGKLMIAVCGEILAALRAPAWQDIETAPRDQRLFFWIVPKTPEESVCNTSGDPITANFKPHRHEGNWKSWVATGKAIYWMSLPEPPGALGRG